MAALFHALGGLLDWSVLGLIGLGLDAVWGAVFGKWVRA